MITALLAPHHVSHGWLPSSSRSYRHHRTTAHRMVVTRTQYTIDDSVCPPTRPEKLEASVRKACASLDIFLSKRPIAAHTQQAFDSLHDLIGEEAKSKPIIMDSGCGTGRSSLLLGQMYPDHLVIGVDRSLARLSKQGMVSSEDDNTSSDSSSKHPIMCESMSDNVVLLRAELVDFWRCCPTDWNITKHYMLYPNPYPKQIRLTQRWYAHPSFPLILKLGVEEIIIRSNWEGYLKEFARSVEIANDFYAEQDESIQNFAEPYLSSAQLGPVPRTDKEVSLTNFERKYDAVGESTYELRLVASSTTAN
jgi:tRNA G46 methylase TrmB